MGRIEFRLPKFGMTMQEATVEAWYVEVGDPITEGQDICEIITDKVNTMLQSPVTGTVAEIVVRADEDAEVGDVLAILHSASKDGRA